jgi:hypothetical protein
MVGCALSSSTAGDDLHDDDHQAVENPDLGLIGLPGR